MRERERVGVRDRQQRPGGAKSPEVFSRCVVKLQLRRSAAPDDLAAYAAAGADQVVLTAFARDPTSLRARLASLAETLLPVAARL